MPFRPELPAPPGRREGTKGNIGQYRVEHQCGRCHLGSRRHDRHVRLTSASAQTITRLAAPRPLHPADRDHRGGRPRAMDQRRRDQPARRAGHHRSRGRPAPRRWTATASDHETAKATTAPPAPWTATPAPCGTASDAHGHAVASQHHHRHENGPPRLRPVLRTAPHRRQRQDRRLHRHHQHQRHLLQRPGGERNLEGRRHPERRPPSRVPSPPATSG